MECVEFLINNGADLFARDFNHNRPIDGAIKSKHTVIISMIESAMMQLDKKRIFSDMLKFSEYIEKSREQKWKSTKEIHDIIQRAPHMEKKDEEYEELSRISDDFPLLEPSPGISSSEGIGAAVDAVAMTLSARALSVKKEAKKVEEEEEEHGLRVRIKGLKKARFYARFYS